MSDTISLNEMRQRVGRAKFGADWIGQPGNEDWDLLKGKYGIAGRTLPPIGPNSTHRIVDEIDPCPSNMRQKLDSALGRWLRMTAQYSTVDTWLETHGWSMEPKARAKRDDFEKLLGQELPQKRLRGKVGRPGRLRDSVIAQMQYQIDHGLISPQSLSKTKQDVLAQEYGASRETVTKARAAVLKGISDSAAQAAE